MIASAKSAWCVNAHGFSLHADVRCAMNQRNKLKRCVATSLGPRFRMNDWRAIRMGKWCWR